MFFDNDIFDRDIWDSYTNSDEYQDLVYEVAYQSEAAMRLFAKRECGKLTAKDKFKTLVRNLLHKLVRYFD